MKFNKQQNIQRSGYTLIEILVVLSISVLVLTIGIPGYRDFSKRQSLTSVSKQMMSDLRLIQQNALTGQKPSGATCTVLQGYKFTRVSASSYQLIASCSNGDIVVKTVSLATNITFTATTATTLFKVLGQGTNLSADNTLVITNSGTSTTSQIIIGVGGTVQ